jgi:hypothetical protein
MVVIGARYFKCPCKEPIPKNPECGDKGVEDDE